jgi:tetratricopeptide (TPR) repeat protein
MADLGADTRAAVAAAGSFVGTFAILLAAIGALFAIDTVLVEKERAERRSDARHYFEEGLRLQRAGQPGAAIEPLRSAVSDERENPAYQRALGAALLAAGKVADAEGVLADRLQGDPTDAAACLIMARILLRERKEGQAIAFYHRAIFGRWEDDAMGNRVQARFELVNLLATGNSRQEMLAELLPLEREAPADASTRKRIARLFLAAGSPARAAGIFREILKRTADDADAYAGLGAAEFQRRNYRSARTAFLASLGIQPTNPDVARRLALTNAVLNLDPTERGIGTEEQYRRSLSLLHLALESAAGCTVAATDPSLRAAADTVRHTLGRHTTRAERHDAAEANVDLAARFWKSSRQSCPRALADSEQAVPLVLEKATQ